MSSRYDLAEVLEDLRCKLDEQLSAAGWVAREQYPGGPSDPHAGELGVFALALRDGFVATAMFEWGREDESDVLVVSGAVGIEYEPARDLLAILTGSEVSGVALRGTSIEARVSSAREVSTAAEQLSALMSARDRRALEEFADVDVLLRLLREHRAVPFEGSVADIDAVDPVHAEHAEGQLVPALLVCAGRYDEARRALAEYERPASSDGWSPREFRRFVRQLTRVLDAGELAIPTTPPFWPPGPIAGGARRRPSLSQVVGKQLLPEAVAHQEAVKAVRAVSVGKTRDELRALLEQELNGRGMSTRSEIIDALVDVLATERKRFGKARIALRGLKAVPELLASWRKPAQRVPYWSPPQASDAEAITEPERAGLELPDRAAYPISGISRRRVTVRLDPAMRAWLDRIKQRDSPGAELTTCLVDVWFTWDTESSMMQPGLNVHIGAERVGHLDPDVAGHFRPAMDAAAERDEDPWTHACLSTISGEIPYVLEIALPKFGDDHARPKTV